MIKKSIIVLATLLSASENIKYTLHSNHAFTLPKNSKVLILEYQKSNKTLDVLHLRDDSLTKNYAGIGDLDGLQLKSYIGIKNNLTALGTLQWQKIEYGNNNNLKNLFIKIAAKYQLSTNFEKTNSISIDIGLKIDKANDINYNNSKQLENLARKFLNVKNVKISNNKIGVIKNDNTTEILNLKSAPSITISNMRDFTPFLTFTAEKEFNAAFISLFSTISYTKIWTDIKANINPADKETEDKIKDYKLSKNLNRNEKSISIGFNITTKTPIITEFSYQYLRVFRDKNLDYIKYNHIIDLDFVKPINKKWFAFLGGKLMYRQFNGVIPYLYNRYSQTTFDHKYGWAKIGIGYYF